MTEYHLKVLRGPDEGAAYTLVSVLTSIGRYSGNAIMILDDQVSRFHARVARTETGCTVEDVGSANGVFVNGVKTNGVVPLKPGDVIRLGNSVELEFNEGTGVGKQNKQEVLDGGDKKGTMMVSKDEAARLLREELAKSTPAESSKSSGELAKPQPVPSEPRSDKPDEGGLFNKLFGSKKND